jgi:predicted metal-dependent hydrolase
MVKKTKTLTQMFNFYNRKYFGGELKIFNIRFKRLPASTYGQVQFYKGGYLPEIEINRSLLKIPTYVSIIVLHEMAHVSLPKSAKHGHRFLAVIKRLVVEGAYDDLL